ncbi:MAG: GNAT family N-acetyltransferase [Nitrososphaerales archaeon]
MSFGFTARVARPSDYWRIVALCKLAVGPDDYVIPRLKHIIASKGLFVASSGSEFVGMSNFSRTIDGAAWFGMARTHPDWRRKGVAIFLQHAKAEHARKLGIRRLRLFVLSTNKPSLRACLKGGFRPVSEAAHLSLNLSEDRFEGNHKFEISREPLLNLLKSRYVKKMKGYVGYDSTFVKIDEQVLEKISRKGEIYSLEDAKFILNPRDEFEPDNHREFSLLEGSVEKGLDSVARTARGIGTDSVGTFIPYEHYLIKMARTLGFRDDPWGWHCICFEKSIP